MCSPPLPPSDEIGISAVEEREFILSKIYELKNPVLAASDDELAGEWRGAQLLGKMCRFKSEMD